MELDEALTDPTAVETWRLDDDTLLTLIPELSTRMRQLDALRVQLVHEAHERCLNQKVGASSTQAWLSGAGKMRPGHAARIIAAGHSLRHKPEVADAFTTGTVDLEQVHLITDFLEQIPTLLADVEPQHDEDGHYVDPVADCTRQCTDHLLDAAQYEHAGGTELRIKALKVMLAHEDGPPPDDENDQLNEFHASRTAGGRVRVKGHFDKTFGEQLMTALSALSKPTPGRNNTTGEPEPDPRSAPQRRADALSDILRHYLDTAAAPGEGGERPHVTVFVGLDNLRNATRNTNADNETENGAESGNDDSSASTGRYGGGDRNGRGHSSASSDGNDGDDSHGNYRGDDGSIRDNGSETRRGDDSDSAADPQDHAAHDNAWRCTDDDAERETPLGPSSGSGARASYLRRGPSWMPWLGPISDRLAALISRDATVTPIVMDDDGNPLDVGRTTRVISRRLRRALDARDCGCAFPGCGRPAAWTDGHHIRHWSNNGETKLSNLVLLCRFHHRTIHKGDWQVFISPDDHHPWFIPPRWIDPDRKPVPAHNRRQLIYTS